MSDPRDPVGGRYRELAREEPPAHLDAAILAASRRAVGARPGGAQRWFVPVSVAAVLVLGIGVALRMQVEQPGIETSAPQSEYTLPSPAAPAEPRPEAKAEAAPRAQGAPPVAANAVTTPITVSPPPPGPPPPTVSSAPAAPAPRAAPAASAFAPNPPAAAEADSARERREAAAQEMSATPEAELERIARLRAADRHHEADRALAEFHRRFPDHRIPAETWERVRPR